MPLGKYLLNKGALQLSTAGFIHSFLEMRKLRPREAGQVTRGLVQMVGSRAERIQEQHV